MVYGRIIVSDSTAGHLTPVDPSLILRMKSFLNCKSSKVNILSTYGTYLFLGAGLYKMLYVLTSEESNDVQNDDEICI